MCAHLYSLRKKTKTSYYSKIGMKHYLLALKFYLVTYQSTKGTDIKQKGG